MRFKHIAITAVVSALFAAVAAFMLTTRNAIVMDAIEGQNTFIFTAGYFSDLMARPAGLLAWCGAYLTQFMNSASGIIALCCLWGAIIALTVCVIKFPAKWIALATIPAAMLFAASVGLEYWIFYMKTPGYLFAGTIGTIVALGGAWLVCRFRKWGIGAIIAMALYPLFGIYALLASILGAILVGKDKDIEKKHKLANYAVAIAALVMPVVWSCTVYHISQLSSAYAAGIPQFCFADTVDSEQYDPYIIFFIALAVIALCRDFLLKGRWASKPLTWIAAAIIIVSAEAAYIDHRWYNDSNYLHELKLMKLVDNEDWQGIVTAERVRTENPTRAIVMMRNLALFKLGRLGDEAFTYRNGDKQPVSDITISIAHTVAPLIYYHYGNANYCYRWLVEHAVDYGWSANSYRYLIRCAIINGEKELAEKYALLLSKTHNYKDSPEVRMALEQMPESEGMKNVRALMNYDDFMGSDMSMPELYLLKSYAVDTANCKHIQTIALHSMLTMRDLAHFWPHFFHFAELNGSSAMPIHFQEAAYLLGRSPGCQVDISGFPFDKYVTDTYEEFGRQMSQYANMPKEMRRERLHTRFSNTYFYYYYLEGDFTTY